MTYWGKFARTIAVVAAGAVIAGCATMNVGRDFNYGDFVSRAKQGETTRDQVREWLGAPAGGAAPMSVPAKVQHHDRDHD